MIAGALAEYAPAPLRLSFIVYFALVVLVALAIVRTPETIERGRARIDPSILRPRVAVPPQIRAEFVTPAVTAFGTFAFVGFYAAFLPTVLSESLHQSNLLVAGAVVAELFGIAAIAMALTHAAKSRR